MKKPKALRFSAQGKGAMDCFLAASAAAVIAAVVAVVAAAAVVAEDTAVAAAAEEKDKNDDPPAAVVVSEHEISPRKNIFIRAGGSFVSVFAGMLYDMKTFRCWLLRNLQNERRTL